MWTASFTYLLFSIGRLVVGVSYVYLANVVIKFVFYTDICMQIKKTWYIDYAFNSYFIQKIKQNMQYSAKK